MIVFIIAITAWVHLYQPVFADPLHPDSAGQQQPAVIKKVLGNGLTLLIKPNFANEVVVVNAFARMGAAYETVNQRGLSKLMQRVLIKGTTTRSARDIAFQTEAVGASIDSGIDNYSSGSVSLKTTVAGFDTSLQVFLDILMNPSFPTEEVEHEKEMMIQQLNAAADKPAGEAFQNFLGLFYGDQPMGMKSDAIAKNVAGISRADILASYRRIYLPGNLVISIIGKVDPQRIEAIFAKSLGQWNAGPVPQPEKPAMAVPNRETDQQMVRTRSSQAIFMVLGYPAPQITEPDFPVMGVINYILGSDMGSRLFVELRDKKGLAYDVSTAYDGANYPSYLYAFMATAPANYQAAKAGIIKEFARLTTEAVPERELEVAKVALKGGYLMEHETNSAQSKFLGSYELMGLGYSFDQDYPRMIEKVTAADVQRVAAKYFRHYSLSVVSPVEIKE
jgi:Predicted Zn-dependent peptidases